MQIDIIPHQSIWLDNFERLKEQLQDILSVASDKILHVGSTSIPRLWAKPILDIDIVIEDRSLLTALIAKLEKAGYEYRGDQGVPGRFAFRQRSTQVPLTQAKKIWQAHHLYACFADALALKNHILFKEALLNNPILIDQYNQLKRSLVDEANITREEYTKRKTTFILSVLSQSGLTQEELKEIEAANR
ncbi:GrpB family protein [Sediminibacterium sp. KACHI17]|jgi:GrpB-like predicted nucleotidyltransferase (UPF0157 family)|uniref:GrpB family protein n=1 Tax=Sediminibacterium sp. KACHI17 TaxID=1751071 RepID=A0AAT9GFM8_9BACT